MIKVWHVDLSTFHACVRASVHACIISMCLHKHVFTCMQFTVSRLEGTLSDIFLLLGLYPMISSAYLKRMINRSRLCQAMNMMSTREELCVG